MAVPSVHVKVRHAQNFHVITSHLCLRAGGTHITFVKEGWDVGPSGSIEATAGDH